MISESDICLLCAIIKIVYLSFLSALNSYASNFNV